MCNGDGMGNGKWTIIEEGEIREGRETRLNDEIITQKKKPREV